MGPGRATASRLPGLWLQLTLALIRPHPSFLPSAHRPHGQAHRCSREALTSRRHLCLLWSSPSWGGRGTEAALIREDLGILPTVGCMLLLDGTVCNPEAGGHVMGSPRVPGTTGNSCRTGRSQALLTLPSYLIKPT